MRIKIQVFLFLLIIFGIYQNISAITLVYNLKIRRAFNANAALRGETKSLWILSALPIVYARTRNINTFPIKLKEKRITGGSLFNARFLPNKHWWFEATTGIEAEHAKSKGTLTFSDTRVGMDDIVINTGYNFFIGNNTQVIPFGLVGFPTRTKVTPEEVTDTFVGTRFFSVGIGSEASYSFINTIKKSLIGIFQVRLIHFFSRQWQPILSCDGKIKPGNVTDLLFTLQYRKNRNVFEAGYNPTFFTNQALIDHNKKVPAPSFLRNSIYLNLSHVFKKVPLVKSLVIVGIGGDVGWSKTFDTRIYAGWLNVTTIF